MYQTAQSLSTKRVYHMDLNQIRSFLAVTQTLNFTNAAKQNGVPQSTISRQIQYSPSARSRQYMAKPTA